jgi:hypothetical protein
MPPLTRPSSAFAAPARPAIKQRYLVMAGIALALVLLAAFYLVVKSEVRQAELDKQQAYISETRETRCAALHDTQARELCLLIRPVSVAQNTAGSRDLDPLPADEQPELRAMAD